MYATGLKCNRERFFVETKLLICSICGSEMDLEGEGGVNGYFGICPIAFCVWCYSSICDMMHKAKCMKCPALMKATKNRKNGIAVGKEKP